MKKYFVIVMIFRMFMVGSYAQDLKSSKVPENVKAAFLKKFPKTTTDKISWEIEKGNYEANWGGKSGEDNSALFTPSGSFVELVKVIPTNQLPSTALTYIKENEKDAKINEAGLVTDAKDIVTYEVELKGKELVFDKDGKFLRVD